MLTVFRNNRVSNPQHPDNNQHPQKQASSDARRAKHSSISRNHGPLYSFSGSWQTDQLCMGGGVAIFHIATGRVVVCRHSVENRWFLPKGRRDPNEDSRVGAEREGFEEVSFAEVTNSLCLFDL